MATLLVSRGKTLNLRCNLYNEQSTINMVTDRLDQG